MIWNKISGKYKSVLCCLLVGLVVTACRMSYSFNTASIDYNVLSTITIQEFPNQAPMVYPPLTQVLTEEMKDIFINKTRLQLASANGDLELEGEITGYDLSNLAVKEDAWASESRLTVTIRVRYTNRKVPEKDFDQSFSAYRDFPATQMLMDVQDQLCSEIVEELVDQVFNATVGDW